MKKNTIVFLFLVLILNSCSIQGLTNDYGKLSEQEKLQIIPLVGFEKLSLDTIYKINGEQLRTELAKHEKSMVYIFKNGCTSDYCKPMYVYENYAITNGYTLFLVMDGYCNLDETLDQRANFSSQLFSIDNEYYNCDSRTRYSRYFENELRGLPRETKSKEYFGSIYFFSKDKIEKITNELPKS